MDDYYYARENLKEIINIKCDSRVLILDNYSNEFTRVGNWIEQDNLYLSNTYGLLERQIWTYKYSPINITSNVELETPLIEIEKTEFAGRQSYEVSELTTYPTDKTKIENEINKVYDVLASGNKAEYLKLMTENTGALATVLKESFYYSTDNAQSSYEFDYYKNDSDDLEKINNETIKKHGKS